MCSGGQPVGKRQGAAMTASHGVTSMVTHHSPQLEHGFQILCLLCPASTICAAIGASCGAIGVGLEAYAQRPASHIEWQCYVQSIPVSELDRLQLGRGTTISCEGDGGYGCQ